MKVKPWLGPEAVLEAFYAALRSQTKNDAFWGELEELLGDLADDMNQRVLARGWAIQNELLDQPVHAELLTQIRTALEHEPAENLGLRPLATSLPQRAGALLLMLAAAIVVGCGGEVDADQTVATGGATQVASGGSVAKPGTTAKGGTTATGGAPIAAGGTLSMSAIDISDGAGLERNCSTENPTSGLDPNQFAACNPRLVSTLIPYDIRSYSGTQLLECLCLLNDAWQTGFAELFSGQGCADIASYFKDCGINEACSADPTRLPSEFDADLFVQNCAVILYLGVRCD